MEPPVLWSFGVFLFHLPDHHIILWQGWVPSSELLYMYISNLGPHLPGASKEELKGNIIQQSPSGGRHCGELCGTHCPRLVGVFSPHSGSSPSLGHLPLLISCPSSQTKSLTHAVPSKLNRVHTHLTSMPRLVGGASKEGDSVLSPPFVGCLVPSVFIQGPHPHYWVALCLLLLENGGYSLSLKPSPLWTHQIEEMGVAQLYRHFGGV